VNDVAVQKHGAEELRGSGHETAADTPQHEPEATAAMAASGEAAGHSTGLPHVDEAHDTDAAPPPATPAPVPLTAPTAPRRTGRMFSAICALIATAAACVALAAPWLRPQVDSRARLWLGADNLVSRLVAAEPPAVLAPRVAEAAPPAVPASAPATGLTEEALRATLAAYDARIQTMSESMRTLSDEVTRAVTALQAGTVAADSVSGTIADLGQRADRLQAAAEAMEARARAANVLALAVALRRDVDAGVTIDRVAAALKAAGPYPPAVDRALAQLMQFTAGIPTMRDLGEAFEPVYGRMVVHVQGSALSRGWLRVKTLVGLAAQSSDDAVLEHLRALVTDGRFSEAANVLETSDLAPLGADWVAMVRARATGVVATQMILNHALQATEAAYAADATTARNRAR